MRKISIWATHHRFPAITFVVILKLLLAFIAFYVGSSLLDLNIQISFIFFIVALGILIGAAFLYPSDKLRSSGKKHMYARQKTCDFIIGACSFVMIGTLVNNSIVLPSTSVAYASNTTTTITPTAEEILASLQYRDKSTLTKKEKRILKEEFKRQLKLYVVAKVKKDKDSGAKTAKIILAIVVALGLLYLLAALCCSLSCNGSDTAAVIVGLLGLFLIVWGLIAVIHRITKGPRKKQPAPAMEGQ